MNTYRNFAARIVLAVVFAGPSSLAQNNVVIQWNSAALQGVRDSKIGPPMVARALAITHTCIYDAWSAYDPKAQPTEDVPALHDLAKDSKGSRKNSSAY